MKKFTWLTSALIILLVFLMTGCDGLDNAKCYSSVADKYPSGKVIVLPGDDYRFIVKTENGDIRYVKTMNQRDADVTHDYLIIKNGN